MSPAVDLTECVERLLAGLRNYDRTVDVVCAFEMVFTASESDLPGTVAHFERFPRIPVEGRSTVTPTSPCCSTTRPVWWPRSRGWPGRRRASTVCATSSAAT